MLIFICDDEEQDLAAMQACLEKAAADLSVDIEISAYSSGKALMKAVEDGAKPELAILDIYIEGINGIEAGRGLRSVLPGLPLAFLTFSRDFAVDAFDLDALHYMVKPVTADMVYILLRRLLTRMDRNVRVLTLPVRRGEQLRFSMDKICRIISKNRGVELYIQGQSSIWLPCLFREIEAQFLDEPDFVHLGRGCMVNMNSIQKIDHDLCCMKNGESLLISRRERSKVQSRYNDFMFSKMNERKRQGI